MRRSSLTLPNAANYILGHARAKFPSLAEDPIGGVWLTGSNVWSFVLGMDPRPDSDWDIFVFDDLAALSVVGRLHLLDHPSCPTGRKRDGDRVLGFGNVPRALPAEPAEATEAPALREGHRSADAYGDGFCYVTDAGEVDVWISRQFTVFGELASYPADSHAHCRAAFSFTQGLVVLPNEHVGSGA